MQTTFTHAHTGFGAVLSRVVLAEAAASAHAPVMLLRRHHHNCSNSQAVIHGRNYSPAPISNHAVSMPHAALAMCRRLQHTAAAVPPASRPGYANAAVRGREGNRPFRSTSSSSSSSSPYGSASRRGSGFEHSSRSHSSQRFKRPDRFTGRGGSGTGAHKSSTKSARDGSTESKKLERLFLNSTGDGELHRVTCLAMRDDTVILERIYRLIPDNGAISVKSLNAQLEPTIQEAVSERHGGLAAFLRKRPQMFVIKPRPTDQVLFVAGNSLAKKRYLMRDVQESTIRSLMGLQRSPSWGVERSGHCGEHRAARSHDRGAESHARGSYSEHRHTNRSDGSRRPTSNTSYSRHNNNNNKRGSWERGGRGASNSAGSSASFNAPNCRVSVSAIASEANATAALGAASASEAGSRGSYSSRFRRRAE